MFYELLHIDMLESTNTQPARHECQSHLISIINLSWYK